ncbi:DUF6777 domain-containing protein [Streptomyces sp. HUAS ZL42]|uniref:DUF6777 domain-containing protein n=1 Tax=Streptomyces sp. HUAS ZL42 TaxID=3231715 RepID=UPI00345E19E6
MALIATVVAAVLALALVVSHAPGTPHHQGEVFLEAAGTTGAHPFTEATTPDGDPPPAAPSPAAPAAGNAPRSLDGDTPGLYGGTRSATRCNVNQQITALRADASKKTAFASALGIEPSTVPHYLRTLTPLRLTSDTLVTNHGYQNGTATSYPSVLQAGSAVLVDDRGVPRVRCACGNPLAPPAAEQAPPRPAARPWPGYRPSHVVAVTPAPHPVHTFVTADLSPTDRSTRRHGDHRDKHESTTTPPPTHTPTASGQASTPPKENHSKDTSSKPPEKRSEDTSSPGPSRPPSSSPETPSAPSSQSSKPRAPNVVQPPSPPTSPSPAPESVAPPDSASSPAQVEPEQESPPPDSPPSG